MRSVSNFDLTPFNELMRDATRARRSVVGLALVSGVVLMLLGLWDLSAGLVLFVSGAVLFIVGTVGLARRIGARRRSARLADRRSSRHP
jgi:hypothetical protein